MKLISSVQVDIDSFGVFDLPQPDGLNNGGYSIPDLDGHTLFEYSPIDLLVSGIEACRLGVKILNLPAFFYLYRNLFSELQVYLAILDNDNVEFKSIADWKLIIKSLKNAPLLTIMSKNAPLTFKWVQI